MRGTNLLTLRSVFCETEECDDELHRVLLFYRERSGSSGESEIAAVDRLLVLGDGLDKRRVAEIAGQTLGISLKPLGAAGVGLTFPPCDLSFFPNAAPPGPAPLAGGNGAFF